MRIAVPTNDGTSVSGHFGRSTGFLIFEIHDGQIQSRELRTNLAGHAHAEGRCGGADGQQAHDHAEILSTLSGCEVVICAGMGRRAADALQSAGVTTVLARRAGSAEAAVDAYLKGELDIAPDDFCTCAH